MTMNDKYWKLSQRIGDVVTQELLKGYCVKDKTLLIQQILQLPFVKIDQPKQLPRQHGIYFVVESELIVYIGKATGEGFYGRWCKHNKLGCFDRNTAKVHYLVANNYPSQNHLLQAEESLIWILKPRFNTVRDSYTRSYAEVFFDCECLTLSHLLAYLRS